MKSKNNNTEGFILALKQSFLTESDKHKSERNFFQALLGKKETYT